MKPLQTQALTDLTLLLQPHSLLRLWVAVLLYETIAFILGMGFFIISVGTWPVIFRLSFLWPPASRLTASIAGVPEFANVNLPKRAMWLLLPGTILRVGIALFIIGLGLHIIFTQGFLG